MAVAVGEDRAYTRMAKVNQPGGQREKRLTK
jgi:hypothetical protein